MGSDEEPLALHSRMKLLKSSIAFKYFLFEDRIKQELGIYTLEEDDSGEYVFRWQYEVSLKIDGVEELFNFLDIQK